MWAEENKEDSMQIILRVGNTDLAEALKSYVDRRLRFALGHLRGRVGQVTVRIGANGRSETRCHISTEVQPFGRVAVVESGPDLFAAIDRATGKTGRLFGRELERVRDARVSRETLRMVA
jgi:ribosome-associated translation inhibitor RaiA